MRERRNAIFTIGVICGIMFIFAVADFFNTDRMFSDTENRILAAKPKFSWEELFSGEYGNEYEEYVTDQFVSRDKWIEIKTRADIALQKKEINGVYLGKEDYLIEKHDPMDYSAELEGEKLDLLKKFVDRWDAKVMLVPTADNILTNKLPTNALYYDQSAFLEKVRDTIGEQNYVDVYSVLKEHEEEEIYYHTDHHWTSLGAYYGYLAWIDSINRFAYPYSVEEMETVSDNFQGTLHSKINVSAVTDSIQIFPETVQSVTGVNYDYVKTSNTLYEYSYLETKNQYGYFLDDNHGLVEIDTKYPSQRTLFILKDSYANCFIPLLTKHYDKIYVMDLRYFNGRLFEFMESCETEKGMDVLLLYNCIHFLEDFKYY